MIYITALVLHNNTKEVSGGYKGRGPRIEPLLEDQGTRMGTYILNHHFMNPLFFMAESDSESHRGHTISLD